MNLTNLSNPGTLFAYLYIRKVQNSIYCAGSFYVNSYLQEYDYKTVSLYCIRCPLLMKNLYMIRGSSQLINSSLPRWAVPVQYYAHIFLGSKTSFSISPICLLSVEVHFLPL
jgi:hypothetical protein